MTAAIAAKPSNWKIEPLRTRRNTSQRHESPGRNRTTRSDVQLVSSKKRFRPSRDTRRRFGMGIGVSLILIAVGAVLTWAVNATVSGLDINTVGVILMLVGVIGLVLSVMFWSSWGGAA